MRIRDKVPHAATVAPLAGWSSVVFGAALVAAPARVGRTAGVPADPRILRAIGLADLTIAFGLLRGRRPARWLGARAALNVVLGGLCVRALRRGTPHPRRAAGVLGLMAAVTPLDGLPAWYER